jgi:hypothetical protein
MLWEPKQSRKCFILTFFLTFRVKFVKWFCGRELAEYNKFFQPGEEVYNGHKSPINLLVLQIGEHRSEIRLVIEIS